MFRKTYGIGTLVVYFLAGPAIYHTNVTACSIANVQTAYVQKYTSCANPAALLFKPSNMGSDSIVTAVFSML